MLMMTMKTLLGMDDHSVVEQLPGGLQPHTSGVMVQIGVRRGGALRMSAAARTSIFINKIMKTFQKLLKSHQNFLETS